MRCIVYLHSHILAATRFVLTRICIFQIRLDPYMPELGHVSKYDRRYPSKRPSDVQHIHPSAQKQRVCRAQERRARTAAEKFRLSVQMSYSSPRRCQNACQ
jgi:hypothetical protein